MELGNTSFSGYFVVVVVVGTRRGIISSCRFHKLFFSFRKLRIYVTDRRYLLELNVYNCPYEVFREKNGKVPRFQ